MVNYSEWVAFSFVRQKIRQTRVKTRMDSGGLLRSGIIPSAPIFSLTSRRGLCEGCQRSPVGQVHDHTADAVNGGKGDPATPLNAPVRAGKWLTGAFYGSRPVVIYPPPRSCRRLHLKCQNFRTRVLFWLPCWSSRECDAPHSHERT